MTILDRFIARQYLINVVALFAILFAFVITVDVSLNLDRFLRLAAQMARAEGRDDGPVRRTLIAVFLVADLWWPRLIQLFCYMLGLVLVGAMGFTCAQLVRHREVVAMLAGGVSLTRASRPILVVALVLTGVQAGLQELALPRVAPLLTRDHGDAGRRALGRTSLPLTADAQGRLWYAREFDAERGTLADLTVWERDDQGRTVRRFSAPSAGWTGAGWRLDGASVSTPGGPGGTGVAGGRGSSPGPDGGVVIETDLAPTALRVRRYAGYGQSLSWVQIGQMLDRLRAQASQSPDPARAARLEQSQDRLERLRFGRISLAAVNLLTLVIALPFFLTREPRNVVVQSLKCAPLAIGALLGGVLGASAPIPGLPPPLAVFVPVLVLLPLAIATATSVRS